MTPSERKLYNRLCKIQCHLFKLIGNIKSIKIALASDYAIPHRITARIKYWQRIYDIVAGMPKPQRAKVSSRHRNTSRTVV